MARAKQPVSVDDIEFDALIDSEEGYEADVPEYLSLIHISEPTRPY